MNAQLTRFVRAAGCAAVFLLAPSAGQAAMLLPGTVVPLTSADILATPPGTLEASVIQPIISAAAGDYTGSLSAAVIRNAGGTLDFYYQITNDPTSTDALSRNTNSRFASIVPPFSYSTEVFYRTDNAGLPAIFTAGDPDATPLAAIRTANARVVAFQFESPVIPLVSGIDPGETSMIVVIRTNATTFSGGFSAVIDGTTTTVNTFGPTGPTTVSTVPEPASLLLLSSAFGVAGYMARHRDRRKKRSQGA
jgi:hypothetical protein